MTDKERLLELVKKHYSRQKIILSSGKESDFYIDGKMVTLSAEGSSLLATVLKPWIEEDGITAIGGLTLGADPIASAISALSVSWQNRINAFIVRKSQKSHGKLKQIEGPVSKNDKIALVDDVITSGGSILQAADAVEKAGFEVTACYALVDRLEGGRQAIEQRGYSFKTVFTADDLRS